MERTVADLDREGALALLGKLALRCIERTGTDKPSLFHGVAGDIMLLQDLYEATGNESLLDEIGKQTDRMMGLVGRCDGMALQDGLSGIMYICTHLDNAGIVETDNEMYDAFDETFMKHIESLYMQKITICCKD